ncbi:hypothetical protein V491_06864 [Pseudogymnoascus sp. VKM F-3775]|nr:hypothetical protein V491_06864 [Pseudogymnoascus sp. VKM F-3775]
MAPLNDEPPPPSPTLLPACCSVQTNAPRTGAAPFSASTTTSATTSLTFRKHCGTYSQLLPAQSVGPGASSAYPFPDESDRPVRVVLHKVADLVQSSPAT